ncbi:hypothetical protein [Epilithonimonas mollis]|uniref:Uncharacterized protein n=1 Tax=Epilithonimonas mollis TaxID=216903 RepID=A0A1M6U9K7_9FLAO|nr:hypothetical protein [Epilithonimonas mollis]SHK65851.1 hypothetical protein SAMN05444371_3224 [Epilithonimonas mollis]
MKTTKIINLMIFMIVLLPGFFSLIKAQDKYAFATWSNAGVSSNDDAFYLVVSDPVKNWYNMSEDQRKEWETSFRISANRQIGKDIMGNYKIPVPDGGSYEKFNSLSACKERIQQVADKFKKDYSRYDKPAKVIYVNLYEY